MTQQCDYVRVQKEIAERHFPGLFGKPDGDFVLLSFEAARSYLLTHGVRFDPPSTTHGPGTELSKLLKRFGIEPTPTCQCRAKAAQMDAWGPDECARPERIEEVLSVMRDEAKARGLPFVDLAGRLLIKRAIANARRAASG